MKKKGLILTVNKVFKFIHIKSLGVTLNYIAIFLVTFKSLSGFLISKINQAGFHEINKYVLYKVIAFCIFAFLIFSYKWIKNFIINEKLIRNKYLLILLPSSAIFLVFSNTISIPIVNQINFSKLFLFIYINIFTFNLLTLNFVKNYIKKYAIFYSFCIAIFAVAMPLIIDKYINAESWPNEGLMQKIDSPKSYLSSRENFYNQESTDRWKNILLIASEDRKVFLDNVETDQKTDNFKDKIYFYSNDKDKLVLSIFNGYKATSYFRYVSPICLLVKKTQRLSSVKTKGDYGFSSSEECIDEVYKMYSGQNENDKLTYKIFTKQLRNSELIVSNKSFDELLIDDLVMVKSNSMPKSYVSDIHPLLAYSLVNGGIAHHYNAVLQTINLSQSKLDLFTNQYGFGPLVIISSIANFFRVENFDALYLSIPISALFIFLLLVIFKPRNNFYFMLLLSGFTLSIFSIFVGSDIFAPMLYFIRYLPSVLFSIYLYSHILGNRTLQRLYFSGVTHKFILFSFALISSLYSFEYGILTSFAFLLTSIYFNDKFYFILGSTFIFLGMMIKFSLQPLTIGQPFIQTFAGIGMSANIDPIFILFLIALLVINIMFYLSAKKIPHLKEGFLLLMLLDLYTLKPIWNSSYNHIGPLFLFMFIICIIILNSGIKSNNVKFFSIFYYFNFLIFFLLCFNLSFDNRLSSKYDEVEYSKADFSKIFSVSDDVGAKIISFKKIFRAGDLILSKNDDLLSIASQNLLTKPYQNVSTNNHTFVDSHLVTSHYLNSSRVLIDKAIAYPDLTLNPLIFKFYGYNEGIDGAINNYKIEVMNMNFIYKALLKLGFSQCAENELFLAICKP